MKRILCAAIAGMLLLTGCKAIVIPSGAIVSEMRSVTGFSAISVASGIRATISTGMQSENVEVEADDNLIEYVETFVSQGSLVLKIRDGVVIKRGSHIHVNVNARAISALSASGGASVEFRGVTQDKSLVASLSGGSRLRGFFRAETAALSLSGGSRFEGTIDAGSVALSMSGGSRIVMEGSADMLALQCSGGSKAEGFGFFTDEAVIKLSGGSNAQLNIERSIVMQASGGSKLIYRGNAIINEQSLSGGSSVVRE